MAHEERLHAVRQLMTPNPFVPMLRIMRDVETAGCRVIKWKLTEIQAWEISRYINVGDFHNLSRTYNELKSGDAFLLGAKVEVKG